MIVKYIIGDDTIIEQSEPVGTCFCMDSIYIDNVRYVVTNRVKVLAKVRNVNGKDVYKTSWLIYLK